MGSFFSSVHIKNNCGREQFVKSFCDIKKKCGLVTCSEDEASIIYILAFSESGKWVTLTSEAYRDNPKQVKYDAQQTAAEMKTSSFSMNVVDSDWAHIELYAGTDIHDTVIVGRSEFPDDDSPKGRREYWEQLLVSGKTWKQFSEIWNKNEVFVEDALYEAASMLGIEPKYMVSDYEDFNDAADEDTNVVPMFFKKKITVSKGGEKKLTLNAAFKQVFGEALKPLGFKKIKGRQPYFVRLIGNEIIHVVAMHKTGDNYFDIVSGVATVYREKIDLSESIRFNQNWLIGISEFYRKFDDTNFNNEYRISIMYFGFNQTTNEAIIKAFESALREFRKWVLPILQEADSIINVLEYFYKFSPSNLLIYNPDNDFKRWEIDNEGLLVFKLNNPYEMIEKKCKEAMEQNIYETEHNLNGHTLENFEENCDNIRKSELRQKDKINNILKNAANYQKTLAELERRKTSNIERLKSYGLNL